MGLLQQRQAISVQQLGVRLVGQWLASRLNRE